MGEWSPWHWAIVAVVLVVLFGSNRLPDAARSLGRSLRIFKTEIGSLHDDDPQQLPTTPGRDAVADMSAPPVPAEADPGSSAPQS